MERASRPLRGADHWDGHDSFCAAPWLDEGTSETPSPGGGLSNSCFLSSGRGHKLARGMS
jgi:hypothetical protein